MSRRSVEIGGEVQYGSKMFNPSGADRTPQQLRHRNKTGTESYTGGCAGELPSNFLDRETRESETLREDTITTTKRNRVARRVTTCTNTRRGGVME